LKGNIRLQTLTVIVGDEYPQCPTDNDLLLNPLAMLNNIPNVDIHVPDEDFNYLEKAVRGPVPGLLRLPPQIRWRIFRMLLTDHGCDRELQEMPRFRRKQRERHSLLIVNHKIYEEAKTVLYGEGLFGFIVDSGDVQCSFSKERLRPHDLEYFHGDRFRMVTRIWVKVYLRRDITDYPLLGSDMRQFLELSNRVLRGTQADLEWLCGSLAARDPLKLLRVYVVDTPLFRGPRRPNFAVLEPFLSLHGIQMVRFEGDIDRKTALEMVRLMEGHPSEFRLYCGREDLIKRKDELFAKWVTWLHRHCAGQQSSSDQGDHDWDNKVPEDIIKYSCLWSRW
jgi:hypothetical protein